MGSCGNQQFRSDRRLDSTYELPYQRKKKPADRSFVLGQRVKTNAGVCGKAASSELNCIDEKACCKPLRNQRHETPVANRDYTSPADRVESPVFPFVCGGATPTTSSEKQKSPASREQPSRTIIPQETGLGTVSTVCRCFLRWFVSHAELLKMHDATVTAYGWSLDFRIVGIASVDQSKACGDNENLPTHYSPPPFHLSPSSTSISWGASL